MGLFSPLVLNFFFQSPSFFEYWSFFLFFYFPSSFFFFSSSSLRLNIHSFYIIYSILSILYLVLRPIFLRTFSLHLFSSSLISLTYFPLLFCFCYNAILSVYVSFMIRHSTFNFTNSLTFPRSTVPDIVLSHETEVRFCLYIHRCLNFSFQTVSSYTNLFGVFRFPFGYNFGLLRNYSNTILTLEFQNFTRSVIMNSCMEGYRSSSWDGVSTLRASNDWVCSSTWWVLFLQISCGQWESLQLGQTVRLSGR